MGALFDNPGIDRPHPMGYGGFQKIYRFKNGYGASVVRFNMPGFSTFRYGSYTDNENEFELAVIEFMGSDDDDFEVTYDTPITDDVLGHLSKKEVEQLLEQISDLPKPIKQKSKEKPL